VFMVFAVFCLSLIKLGKGAWSLSGKKKDRVDVLDSFGCWLCMGSIEENSQGNYGVVACGYRSYNMVRESK